MTTIVVGGGHNGLTCAAYLARAGRDVLVLEARDQAGGCASTVDALGGARVNVCNCDHTLIRLTGIVEDLELERHGLRYLDLDPSHLNIGWDPGDRAWMHFQDPERTLESLSLAHPGQVSGYARYLKDMLPAARLLVDIMRAPPTLRNVAATTARHHTRGAARLARLSRSSLAGALGRYFTSEALIGPVATTGPAVWGLPPTAPGTGLGALGYAIRHLGPTGRPEGGSGALTDALTQAVRAAGGEVRTGARVAKVLCDRDRVTAVELTTGERLPADTVIGATDPRALFTEWLENPPPYLARRYSTPANEGYESKVDAVIDRLPRARALNYHHLERLGVVEPLIPTTVVAPTVSGIAQAHRDAQQGRVAHRPLFLTNVPSIRDPSIRLPDGAHVLSLEVLFTPYRLKTGWANTTEPERWLTAYADLLEPGFLDGIRTMRLVGPEDYERDFGLHRGHAPSYPGSPLAALIGRDKELSRYATPVRGLFLTGAATFPGAGVSGAPGRNTALTILAARSSDR